MLSIRSANELHRNSIQKCFMSLFDASEYEHMNKIEDLREVVGRVFSDK